MRARSRSRMAPGWNRKTWPAGRCSARLIDAASMPRAPP